MYGCFLEIPVFLGCFYAAPCRCDIGGYSPKILCHTSPLKCQKQKGLNRACAAKRAEAAETLFMRPLWFLGGHQL